MFNKVILLGNLTRDVEIRYSQSNSAISRTAIATSRKFTVNGEKKEETCFIDITFFGRSGEIAHQYLRKGSKVMIEGRLSFEQWSDQNGQKHSKHSVIVETMQMVDSRANAVNVENTNETPTPSYTAQKQLAKNQIEQKVHIDDYNPFDCDGIKEEDMPF